MINNIEANLNTFKLKLISIKSQINSIISMEQAVLPLIDGYRLQISCIGSILLIEAEEESSKRSFSLRLDGDSVAQASNQLFSNIKEMYQGLTDAINNVQPGVEISFAPTAKLNYKAVLSLGVIKKEYSFSLALEEKHLDATTLMEKKLNSLIMQVKRNEETSSEIVLIIQKLEKTIMERLDKMEKRLDALEESSNKKPQNENPYLIFNPYSVNASYYTFQDNNKTISLSSKQGLHPCLECLPGIAGKGQHKYSLKLVLAKNEGTAIGITPITNVENWNHDKEAYWYWTSDGLIRGAATSNRSEARWRHGDVISVLVDMDVGKLTFSLNNYDVTSCSIARNKVYYLYVSLGALGNSVTLI